MHSPFTGWTEERPKDAVDSSEPLDKAVPRGPYHSKLLEIGVLSRDVHEALPVDGAKRVGVRRKHCGWHWAVRDVNTSLVSSLVTPRQHLGGR